MQLAAKQLTAQSLFENAQKNNQRCYNQVLASENTYFFSSFFTRFYVLSIFCSFLRIDYILFRSFNFGSIDVQTDFVLLDVWQLAIFKDNGSKHTAFYIISSLLVNFFV